MKGRHAGNSFLAMKPFLGRSENRISIFVYACVCVCFCSTCRFDPGGLKGNGFDGSVVDAFTDGSWADGFFEDVLVEEDGSVLCQDGDFSCTNSGAKICDNSEWVSLGPCFLGCMEEGRACMIPSNVNPEALGYHESMLEDFFPGSGSTIHISTDNGAIFNVDDATFVRIEGEGGLVNGIGFYRRSQPGKAPPLGIFVVRNFKIPENTLVTIGGGGAFVVIATGDVVIEGVLDAGAQGARGGAGGFDGGSVGLPGGGPYPGQAGQIHPGCPDGCASGSGGGGLGGEGGIGGAVDCSLWGKHYGLAGGRGGEGGGNEGLSPLLGGSGGGGGVPLQGVAGSEPGLGGGGGGAVQISARGMIDVGENGVITCPGGGGRQTTSGGGSGGGAGGGILLESDIVVVSPGGIVAANGGGGGGGDCMIESTDIGGAGQRGTNTVSQALGGVNLSGLAGGDGGGGGYGDSSLGDAGQSRCVVDRGSNGGGGGGGTGWIRINTADGEPPALEGVISPSPDTTAFSVGKLKRKPLP